MQSALGLLLAGSGEAHGDSEPRLLTGVTKGWTHHSGLPLSTNVRSENRFPGLCQGSWAPRGQGCNTRKGGARQPHGAPQSTESHRPGSNQHAKAKPLAWQCDCEEAKPFCVSVTSSYKEEIMCTSLASFFWRLNEAM